MAGYEDFTGSWELVGLPLAIVADGDRLVVHLPGTPEGFDPTLEPTDHPRRFIARSGEFDGLTLEFSPERGPAAEARFGPMPLVRGAEPFTEPPGHGLLAPDLPEDEDRDARFATLEAGFGDGAAVPWIGPETTHSFVRWLMTRDRYIFHGSTNREIEEFVPVRTSAELRDHGERGNLDAVYGTHDGLWSMFFAVIDRAMVDGSIRNGVMRFESSDGRSVHVYHFTVDSESLGNRPFKSGALYVFSREQFRRLLYWPGGPPSNEWASETTVLPLARLLVEPEDFPFLDRIGGHDDAPLLRMHELGQRLGSAATSATESDRGLTVTLDWSDDLAGVYDEWLSLWRLFMPNTEVSLDGDGTSRRLTIDAPPAVRGMIRRWFGGVIDDGDA